MEFELNPCVENTDMVEMTCVHKWATVRLIGKERERHNQRNITYIINVNARCV